MRITVQQESMAKESINCLHNAIDEIGMAVTSIMAERTKDSANENGIESTITILQDLQTKIDNKAYVFSEEIKTTGDVKLLPANQPKR
jgi:hypothetical protein